MTDIDGVLRKLLLDAERSGYFRCLADVNKLLAEMAVEEAGNPAMSHMSERMTKYIAKLQQEA
jgi:hypothetical protein